ncbi:hypothetical protein HDU96_009426 [Phlyctochytrium bullatum]|nr:hypothetical protein HDU96_009426 [Phlyctochytrium bullatum]
MANTARARLIRIFLNQLLFLVTGMAGTLGAQWLKYQGAADSISFLTLLAQYLGMFLVVFLPPSKSLSPSTAAARTGPFAFILRHVDMVKDQMDALGPVSHKGVMWVSAFDVFGNMILAAGLFLTGSGLYMVIYSSIIVFTALGNRLLLAKIISPKQWIAVIVITIGLSLTAIGKEANGAHVGLGIVVSLVGTGVHAMVYILNEHLLSDPSGNMVPATPKAQCVWVGFYSTALTLASIVVVSIPDLMTMSLFRFGVIFMYGLLVLSSMGHAVSYFYLVESTGGVATGVLQALRAVGVFGLSHFWYCGVEESQCYTTWKGIATVVVVTGVIGFALAKSMDGAKVTAPRVLGGYEEVTMDDFDDSRFADPAAIQVTTELPSSGAEKKSIEDDDDKIFDL